MVECWLRLGEVSGSIHSQGPRHTKDVIKMIPIVSLFSTEHSNTGSFSRMKKSGIEILQSRRSLAVVAGMKKTNDHAEPTKVEQYIKKKNADLCRHKQNKSYFPYRLQKHKIHEAVQLFTYDFYIFRESISHQRRLV